MAELDEATLLSLDGIPESIITLYRIINTLSAGTLYRTLAAYPDAALTIIFTTFDSNLGCPTLTIDC